MKDLIYDAISIPNLVFVFQVECVFSWWIIPNGIWTFGKFLTIRTWITCALLNSVQKVMKIQGCLLLAFFICLHNQLSFSDSVILKKSEKRVHQIDSKNELLLLSVTLTAKLELVFVLTFENAFSYSFHFIANRKSIGSSKK